MKRFLGALVVSVLLLAAGCGSPPETGPVNITLLAEDEFLAAPYALGCLVLSNDKTACLCSVNGVSYVDGEDLPSFCSLNNYAITLVSPGTQFTYENSGERYYCLTLDASTDCDSGVTGSLEILGQEYSSVVPTSSGRRSAVVDWVVTFSKTQAAATQPLE